MPFVLASSITSDLFLTVIVNVPPADDEQTVRVPKTGEQVKKRVQAGWQSVCSGTTIRSQLRGFLLIVVVLLVVA